MNPTKKRLTFRHSIFAIAAAIFLLVCLAIILWVFAGAGNNAAPFRYVSTVAGIKGEFGEPFGIAVKGSDVYISDGQNGKIWLLKGESLSVFAEGFDTPSAISFDAAGNLLVADTGSHTIKSVNSNGIVTLIAGIDGSSGFADGGAASALFNAPIGIAVGYGKIFVADTYNDRIRVIENGKVTTLAGSSNGLADGVGDQAKFDTPCGITVWQDKLLVADTGNHRIRVVEADGRVWTLAGNGEGGLKDGLLSASSFVQPTAVAVDNIQICM